MQVINVLFQSMVSASVLWFPSATLPLLMCDSIAKTLANVMNAWYAPRLVEKCLADLNALELATITMQMEKHKLKVSSILIFGTFNTAFVSPIPYIFVGMTIHLTGYYLIYMDMPRQTLVAKLIEGIVFNLMFSILGYAFHWIVAKGIVYF